MIVIEKISSVAKLLSEAAQSRSTVGFRKLHEIFDEGTRSNDVYDTLEAASRALCDTRTAIYSAVLAKNSDGCPGSSFYDIFNNIRSQDFFGIAGHNDIHKLTDEDRVAMAGVERDRVYQHAEED
ncbi:MULTISPECIES: hypothetical protein [Xanthomonas]|uniref:hypothetical protein n=2 Tax=Xanthomonas TaxID=338 RepID=UPI000ABD62D3|nr:MULTISPECIES: hypothetical protein [Xanthomonas]MBZ2438405.1 hypothetical protein [Xanthomonas perforans]MBZ2493891.1 hypothetical protein [Xanthomonas perforans]MBZ2498461.1 hypothetical protein [Xanthomonas perforans]MBZ2501793.1 hypothetical protein [Xanthomonas perforans]MBZ2510542.1 hypothetical protein [Xanthomonas perforans]